MYEEKEEEQEEWSNHSACILALSRRREEREVREEGCMSMRGFREKEDREAMSVDYCDNGSVEEKKGDGEGKSVDYDHIATRSSHQEEEEVRSDSSL